MEAHQQPGVNLLYRTSTQGYRLRLRLVREKKIFWVSHQMCRKDVGRGFRILIKKQITEPVRKLRDESNDTN
jgi:hypothetical protein